MNTEEIHKHLTTSEIYDRLRQAHSLVKDIIHMKDYNLTNTQENAIDTVSGVLYLAEGKFSEF